ncbi:glycosyltransferase [Pectinatus frisingensis]|uniref:glycosyltransferase family protein n=1 Tax=Pectinatus frisingensis TaxID=865 RepID=UPI0018C7BABB|nr:glycosyltransferase [Pectinatus frisingensis]
MKYYHSYRTHKISAYFFNPVDDELPEKYGHDFCKKTRDIVFTGSAYNFAGIERKDVIRYLLTRNDVNFFGGIENIVNANNIFHKIKRKFLSQGNRYNKRISGEEYVAVIKSAKIGIGVNAIQTVPRYTSDRLQHFMSFGTFFLQFYFPELEKFFNLKEEIVSFKSIYELEKYIDYYLKNPEQREKIARAGQCKILSCYNTKNITKMMLDIINTGNSTMFEWTDILS